MKPLGDKILVRVPDLVEKTQSGIYMPENMQERPLQGVVTAVGRTVVEINVGDTVIYSKHAGREVKHAEETFLLMKEAEVDAII